MTDHGIHALGVTLAVDLSATDIDPVHFNEVWSRCAAPEGAVGEPLAIRAGSSLETATQQITRALIDSGVGRLLMLHAGAVAHPTTGRALVYVARGGTGKSTLTKTLATRYGYLTDETVAIVPGSWEILPYPKPITLALHGHHPKSEHSPDELGLLPAPPSPHVAGLAVLRRTPGRDSATFTPLGVLDAITMMAPESSSLARLDEPLRTVAALHDAVGCTLVEYGETTQIADWCSAILDGEAAS